MTETFPTVEEFYEAHPPRRRSPEFDFGVLWMDTDTWPITWRVSYIDLTGELYATVNTAGGEGGLVELLGRFPLRPCPTCAGSGGSRTACIACAGTGYSRQLIQAVLAGWANMCGELGSLEWVRRRVRGEPAPTPTQPFARAREEEFRV